MSKFKVRLREGSDSHHYYTFGELYDAEYVGDRVDRIYIYRDGKIEDNYPVEGGWWKWDIVDVPVEVKAKESDRKEVAKYIREIQECFNEAIKECQVVGIDASLSIEGLELKVDMTHTPEKRSY